MQGCSSILPRTSAQRLRLFLLLPLRRQPQQRQPIALALKAGLPALSIRAALPLQWDTAANAANSYFLLSAGQKVLSKACEDWSPALTFPATSPHKLFTVSELLAGGGALSAGAIAGIVLGGTVALALCMAMILIHKRRSAPRCSRVGGAQSLQPKATSDSIAMAALHSGQPGSGGLQKSDPEHSSSAANGVHPHCVRQAASEVL